MKNVFTEIEALRNIPNNPDAYGDENSRWLDYKIIRSDDSSVEVNSGIQSEAGLFACPQQGFEHLLVVAHFHICHRNADESYFNARSHYFTITGEVIRLVVAEDRGTGYSIIESSMLSEQAVSDLITEIGSLEQERKL